MKILKTVLFRWLWGERDKLCRQTAFVFQSYTKGGMTFCIYFRHHLIQVGTWQKCVKQWRLASSGHGISPQTSLPLLVLLPTHMEERAKTLLCLVQRCVHRESLLGTQPPPPPKTPVIQGQQRLVIFLIIDLVNCEMNDMSCNKKLCVFSQN